MNPSFKMINTNVVIVLAGIFLSGCLASTPKKTNRDLFLNTWISQNNKYIDDLNNYHHQNKQNPFASANESVACHDRSASGSYSEDQSPECVRSQTLKAYEALHLQMDPEVPYCILRQESSQVKDDQDPYQTDFNRLAICRRGKKMCGLGLAQFTFGTWSGYDSLINEEPDKRALLTNCLNALAANTALPKNYSHPSIQQISPSHVDEIVLDAKTKPPGEALNPFYRDHAICMNALHLSEIPSSGRTTSANDAITGKGKNRRKIHTTAAVSQAQRLGDAYNGGGTAGYGKSIGRCVMAFREFDDQHNVASNTLYLLKGDRNRELASSSQEDSTNATLQSSQQNL